MNNVIDEVLAGEPRYTIKDNGGTTLYDNVQIDLKTQVTTPGTPLNKALFDSIQADLNTRLLISDKATDAEAIAGRTQYATQMNDTKYMTPRKTQRLLNSLISFRNYTNTGTSYVNTTVVDFGTIYNAHIVTITGKAEVNSQGNSTFIFNGSRLDVLVGSENTYDPSQIILKPATRMSGNEQAFQFKFDLNTFTFTGTFWGENGVTSVLGTFRSISTFQIRTYRNQEFSATIQLDS